MATSIAQFNEWLENAKNCGECPMLGRGVFVGADSSTETATAQPVLFLGLNPGNEEARIGRPFVGPSGRFLRAQLENAGITSWGMANSLLCSSANETEIVEPERARACCHGNLAIVFRLFQPKIIIPCGNGAWSLFQVRLGITAATEQVFISRGPSGKAAPVFVLPIFHPSALIRTGGTSSAKFPAFFKRLESIAELASLVAAASVEEAAESVKSRGLQVKACFTATQQGAMG